MVMRVLDRITGTACGTSVTVGLAAAAPPRERVVMIPKEIIPLMQRADIKPPQAGPLEMRAVDDKLRASDLTMTEKLACKITLRNCGLLG
jgi:hypothetical protein